MSSGLRACFALLLACFAPAAYAADPGQCGAVSPVPETFQVAWVSPLGARVGAHTSLQVVRVADLRKLAEARKRDPAAVLQALGLVGKRGLGSKTYKVTIFDVKGVWLCRPIEDDDGPDVAVVEGLAVCPGDLLGPGPGTKRRSYTGCGYLVDAVTKDRTLDVFRIEWENAITWGFCVMPLQRFLDGA